jgi:transposase, IS5 family
MMKDFEYPHNSQKKALADNIEFLPMSLLTDITLNDEYNRIQKLGNRLADLSSFINWEGFRPILGQMFTNDTDHGGRQNADVITMKKMLILQFLYGISDP